MSADVEVKNRLVLLESVLEARAPWAVAVSGGVDSMTLAFIAHRVCPQSEMFHALSPAVPKPATARVREYARSQGWNLREIDAGETRDPAYVKNPANRCYYCKHNLYATIRRHTRAAIASGTNTGDLDDYRPGLRAATEYGVYHPFVEAGIDKGGVRALADYLGLLDLKNLPASPCLASRVATGIAIDAGMLPLIHEVETRIRDLLPGRAAAGAVRCRVRRDHIAVQIETGEGMDYADSHGKDIRRQVRRVFRDGRFSGLSGTVLIEPYKRGDAFIVESGVKQ